MNFMESLPEFLANHWLLSTVWLLLGLVLLGTGFRARLNGLIKVSPQEAVRLMNDNAVVVLDIRSQGDYQKGTLQGAVNLPFSKVGSEAENILKKQKDKAILVVDSLGYQEVAAGAMLAKQGFGPVHYLAGGISSWQSEQLPLCKPK